MPAVGGGLDQRIGALGTIRSFVGVLREISFEDVRDDAETVPRLLIVAPTTTTARQLGTGLTGPEGELATSARELRATPGDLERFDAIVVFDPERSGVAAAFRDRLAPAGAIPAVFSFEGSGPDDLAALDRLRSRIMRGLSARAPAFGRAFPAFRAAAAKSIIDETALANAQFALLSNIPAIVPVIGSLAAAGADFIVLTKNQVMMMFKLGAIYGRDLNDQWSLVQELVPVVGAGLLWRTVAREAASFVPFAAGTIPKVAIAYAGTLAVGRGAEFYFRTNRKPTAEQVRGYYRQAADAVRRLPGLSGRDEHSSATRTGPRIETGSEGDGPAAIGSGEPVQLHGASANRDVSEAMRRSADPTPLSTTES